jgi:hypothetical protein
VTVRSLSLLIVTICTTACSFIAPARVTPQIATYVIEITATTDPSTPTSSPTPSQTPTRTPRPTSTVTPTIDVVAAMRESLSQIMQSPDWQNLELPSTRRAQWEAFASGGTQLDTFESQQAEAFTKQWKRLEEAMSIGSLPASSSPQLRVKEFATDQGETPVLYVVDGKDLNQQNDESLYLLSNPLFEKSKGLLLAPEIDGLTPQISTDGAFVEYLDPNGVSLIKADARPLDKEKKSEERLKEILDREYTHDSYRIYSLYPRYHLERLGIDSSFYGMANLTYKQIQLLESTLDIFDDERIQPLKPYIFPEGDQVSFILSRYPHDFAAAQAVQMGGSPPGGVIILYTRNLFSNRYETAASLAHEAAHIWQGDRYDCSDPKMVLKEEIGTGTVPGEFSKWTVDELRRSVARHTIGAYHLSLWVSMQLGAQNLIDFYRWAINSGNSNPHLVTSCP